MIEFVAANWGGLVSVLGVIVSSIGLGWAISEARRARNASQAAQDAARETRSYIARHLQAVDLERAIALIQRIKLQHDTKQWDAAMEQYQSLRFMLSNIIARCPAEQAGLRDELMAARTDITKIEDSVRVSIRSGNAEPDPTELNRDLNGIQSSLEQLASAIGFGDDPGGMP